MKIFNEKLRNTPYIIFKIRCKRKNENLSLMVYTLNLYETINSVRALTLGIFI